MEESVMDDVDNDAGIRLEAFIQDWHWDTASHRFARQAGAFLFYFTPAHTAGAGR